MNTKPKTSVTIEEAFQKLKEFLVDKHKKELKSLQQSLERLEEMTFSLTIQVKNSVM